MLWQLKFKSLRNRNLQQDLDDELRSHIAMKVEDLEAGGMSAEEAEREARRRFGDLMKAKESTRELHVFNVLETIFQDLRYALRRLRREPAFSLAAILTLGLVIGANGSIFSVLEATLLRPLPFADPSRLVLLFGSSRQSSRELIPVADFGELQKARTLASVAAEQTQSVNLTGVEEPGRLIGSFVSSSYFTTLGVQPAAGRSFSTDEGIPGGPRVCILSYPVWRDRFGKDEHIVGRSLLLNDEPYTIIGILPEQYRPTFTISEVWIPLHFYPNYSRERGRGMVTAIARLADGVTLDQARAELTGIARNLARQFPQTNRDRGVTVQAAREVVQGNARDMLSVLTGAVLCVLLLGCANIAGLLLTKAAGRRHEIAIRTSVGAGRGRLVRQLLTECLLLSTLGGAFGIVIAWAGTQLLIAYCPDLVGGADLRLNTPVISFLAGVSTAAGILFGLVPALLTQRESSHALRQRGAGLAQGRWRGLLVAGQIALALVLLIGSGIMLKSASNLATVNPGFQGDNVLTMEYRIPRKRYPLGLQQTQFHHEVIARVAALPGVKSVAIVGALPFSGNTNHASITLPDRPEPPREAPFIVELNTATPYYFKTVGIPQLAGRDFQLNDGPDTQPVAIVNQAFAARFWPGQNALGKQIDLPGADKTALRLTVAGVVGNIKQDSLVDPDTPQLYRPYAQSPFIFATLAVQTSGAPLSMTKAVQRTVWSVDKNQPMWKIRTLQSLVDRSFSARRTVSSLLLCFSVLALGLAAVGLYGVVAFGVSQRTAEFGVRIALGARPREILALVVRKGLALTLAGLAGGIAISLLATPFLKTQVFGISTADPVIYGTPSLILLVVAMLAVMLPARRAMLVDPVIAIRQE